MIGEICRLCFKKEMGPIGIFSAKGVKLDIANLIHLHFLDEVSSRIKSIATNDCIHCNFFPFCRSAKGTGCQSLSA